MSEIAGRMTGPRAFTEQSTTGAALGGAPPPPAAPPGTTPPQDSPAAANGPDGDRPAAGNPPSDRRSALTRFAVRMYWLWPMLITAGFGLWHLNVPALWADELATWGAVRLSWSGLFKLLGNTDSVVGPYYVLLKLWTSVAGTSTVALRLPSVLAMVLAAGLVTVLGDRLAGRWVGLLAGVGFALMPTTSRYAQEARPYAFAILFAVLATLLLVRLLDGGGWWSAAGYAGSILLLGVFHLIALLLLVGHAVPVLYRRSGRVLARWVIAVLCGVAPLSWLAWLGARQRGQISWIPVAHWRTLVGSPSTVFTSGLVAGAVVLLAVLGLSRRRPAVLLAGWAAGPTLALFLLAKVTPVFWPRYLLYTVPAFVLLGALFLGRQNRWRAVLVLIVIGLLGAPAQSAIRAPDGHSHATKDAAGIIAANELPGDGSAFALHERVVPWEARDIIARYVPAAKRPTDTFAVTPQRTDGRMLATECADLTACLGNTQRLWIVRFETQNDPLANIGAQKEALLRADFTLSKIWLVRGLTVALMTRR